MGARLKRGPLSGQKVWGACLSAVRLVWAQLPCSAGQWWRSPVIFLVLFNHLSRDVVVL